MKKQFNTKQFQNKSRVYSKVEKGISKCWTWDEAIKEYRFTYFECRKKGLLKKEDKKTFQDLKACKNWLYQTEVKLPDFSGLKFLDIFGTRPKRGERWRILIAAKFGWLIWVTRQKFVRVWF